MNTTKTRKISGALVMITRNNTTCSQENTRLAFFSWPKFRECGEFHEKSAFLLMKEPPVEDLGVMITRGIQCTHPHHKFGLAILFYLCRYRSYNRTARQSDFELDMFRCSERHHAQQGHRYSTHVVWMCSICYRWTQLVLTLTTISSSLVGLLHTGYEGTDRASVKSDRSR